MVGKKKRFDKKLLFYIGLLALPLLQFCIFYVYVNFKFIALAFKGYDVVNFTHEFVGFANFQTVFDKIFISKESTAFAIRLKNSLFNYAMTLLVGMVGAVVFSYYIYKKQFLSGTFKIVLFLPHIIPSVALISIFKYFVDAGGVTLVNSLFDLEQPIETLLKNDKYNYPIILSYSLFMGFGTQVLMYLGAMNKINPSITEAAELDGITFFKELWYITLPNVLSTITTFFVVGLTTFFTSDVGVYTFFAENAGPNIQTIGYYLKREIVRNTSNEAQWGYLSAFGLCCTLIVAPLSYTLRQILEKADPLA